MYKTSKATAAHIVAYQHLVGSWESLLIILPFLFLNLDARLTFGHFHTCKNDGMKLGEEDL